MKVPVCREVGSWGQWMWQKLFPVIKIKAEGRNENEEKRLRVLKTVSSESRRISSRGKQHDHL